MGKKVIIGGLGQSFSGYSRAKSIEDYFREVPNIEKSGLMRF